MFVSFGKGKRFRAPVGKKVAPMYWDSKKQRVKPIEPRAKEINSLLASMAIWADNIHTEALKKRYETGQYYEVQFQDLHTEGNNEIDVMDTFDKFVDYKRTQGISPGTIANWISFRSTLVRYGQDHGTLTFNVFTKDFESNILKWLVDKGESNSTTRNKIGALKDFLTWAAKNKYHNNREYLEWGRKLKVPSEDDNLFILDLGEIERIRLLTFDDIEDKALRDKYEELRDVVIFNCWFGLRHSDLKSLQKSQLTKDNGRYKCAIKTQKTGEPVRFYLTREAQEIYENYMYREGTNALPVPSRNIYNKRLQEVCRRAQINEIVERVNYIGTEEIISQFEKWQLITSHKIRGTFVTLAYNYYDFTLDEIKLITGHKSDVIKRYLKIQPEKMRKLAQKAEDKNREQRSKETD
ncbi:MAG: phage integrase SAM-like domain-containing protein [Bacteroidota bacterium]